MPYARHLSKNIFKTLLVSSLSQCPHTQEPSRKAFVRGVEYGKLSLGVEKNDFNSGIDLGRSLHAISLSLSNKSATSNQSALYGKRYFTFNVFLANISNTLTNQI